MRSLLIVLALLAGTPAWAELTTITCSACRSVYTYPRDFGNHAFNQVLGDHATIPLVAGSRIKVVNPRGEWAVVDLSFVLEQTGLNLSILILSWAFVIPDGTIRIRVQDDVGHNLEYEVFVDSPDLRVGDGSVTGDPPPELLEPFQSLTIPGGEELFSYEVLSPYPYGMLMPVFYFELGAM